MEKYTEVIGRKLNAILEKTYDAEKGFGKAAENCEVRSLATWFNERALDRHRFINELKREINAFGEGYKDNGTLAGDAHRTWMDIKSLFSKDHAEAMLEEAIRGEKVALEEYKEVLKEKDLPRSTIALLTSQMAQIDYGLALIMGVKDLDYEKQ
ncbi:PA2169 family four-helix-bundle protein [uncultured Kriegella sp.]|uniref:ferritin-like domain-containing protein n=1 Tax=uncultured Kriegella sp. TaxID=1798910 RepID=UPI0030DA6DB9|tara:strand:+ start:92035 stop:92496 length:462 start_codon:yes stop_codon:yes gene_type:complete